LRRLREGRRDFNGEVLQITAVPRQYRFFAGERKSGGGPFTSR